MPAQRAFSSRMYNAFLSTLRAILSLDRDDLLKQCLMYNKVDICLSAGSTLLFFIMSKNKINNKHLKLVNVYAPVIPRECKDFF